MTKFALGVMVCILLAGCATTATPVQSVEVRVPVTVPCKAPVPARPAFAVDTLPIGSGIWDQMNALRAERLQRQGYEVELEAAIQSCQ